MSSVIARSLPQLGLRPDFTLTLARPGSRAATSSQARSRTARFNAVLAAQPSREIRSADDAECSKKSLLFASNWSAHVCRDRIKSISILRPELLASPM
jgi:hypothetical protein